MKPARIAAWLLLLLVLSACIGTTGSELVTFPAFAAGPADANGQPLTFTNGRGWNVTLTKAQLHIGAVYLNRSVPVSGGQERECFLPGVYVAEVLRGVDIDALSPSMTPFPGRGNGTEDRAVTGEVWLTGQRIDSLDDRTTIADVAGTATNGVISMRFEGTITIGNNRTSGSTDPARPGAKPLCSLRIVTPIPVDITPRGTGALLVRVDPREWFGNVDFGELEVMAETDLRRFSDDESNQAARNLFIGVRSASSGAYRFEWLP